MAGTKAGGIQAGKSNIARHGKDYYKRLGAKGGSATKTKPGGFLKGSALTIEAGRKGGLISRRRKRQDVAVKEWDREL